MQEEMCTCVCMPLSREALGDLEDTAVVVATLDGPRAESLVDGKVWTDTGRPIQAVAPAVDASLVDRRTLSVREVRLTTPIYLRVADVAPEPNFICAYFDGEFWSTQGVRLATVEELQAGVRGYPLFARREPTHVKA